MCIYIGPHHITGNGVGFKPDILEMDVMEEVLMVIIIMSNFHLSFFTQQWPVKLTVSFSVQVSSEEAVNMARQLALKEGLMVIFI